MAMHNNVIANNHFHKKWQQYVRGHFNQATQAKSRRLKRAKVRYLIIVFHRMYLLLLLNLRLDELFIKSLPR